MHVPWPAPMTLFRGAGVRLRNRNFQETSPGDLDASGSKAVFEKYCPCCPISASLLCHFST